MVLTVFWGIISLLFLYLMIYQHKWHGKEFKPLEYPESVAKRISGVSTGAAEVKAWANAFTKSLNDYNKKISKAQIIGYGAAFLAALSSFTVSIINL